MNETTLITVVFVISMVMLIMAFTRIVSIMLPGSNVVLPALLPGTEINPGHAMVFYPSLIFQVWFWAERLGVFVQ